MSTLGTWLVAQGFADYDIEHKFGRNESMGSNFEPCSINGVYRTPQIGSATPLRIAAGGDANDTAAGTGAREITVQYLDTNMIIQTETLVTDGASASSYTSGNVFRLLRFFVSASGNYSDASTGFGHVGNITLEDSSSNVWGAIDSTGIARGQSQIGVWTVPSQFNGYEVNEVYVSEYFLTADGNKNVDFILFSRGNADETAPPYSSARIVREHALVSGGLPQTPSVPLGPYLPGTDIGWMVKSASSASATVDTEFVIVKGDKV